MIYILFAIIMFGILIFVHELGHFLAARACGVKVNEFAMGMGPTLWKKEGKNTVYSLHAFPIGGFCAMEGEDEDTDAPDAFNNQKGWKKFIILVAGAAMNFLFGLILIIALYAQSTAFVTPQLAGLMDGCPSAVALQEGDTILSINGSRVFLYSDISTLLSRGNGETANFVVRRDGEKVTLNDVPCYLQTYETESGTAQLYGFQFRVAEASLGTRINYAFRQAAVFVRTIWFSLEELVSGAVGVRDLSGPIGIVSTMSQVGEASSSALDAFLNLIYFAAFVAVNLAVMNLLPLPALDGGRIFFLIINGLCWLILRKKIPAKYEGYVHGVGLVLLLALMAFVAVSDILRIAGV
jgi:regulator of sigma E protease